MADKVPDERYKEGQGARLKRTLGPIILITVFLGIVASTVESILDVLNLAQEYFFLVATVFWVAIVLLVWRWQPLAPVLSVPRDRLVRIFVVVLATVFFLFAIGLRLYKLHFEETGPTLIPDVPPLSTNVFSIKHANAQTGKASFKIVSFYLNTELCSFKESQWQGYRAFSFNEEVADAFLQCTCIGRRGVHPITRVVPVFRKHLEETGQKDLLMYVKNTRAFVRLGPKNPQIFNQIMFSKADLQNLKESNKQAYEIVKEWMLNCVGVHKPVLTLAVKNEKDKTILLTEVIYDVEKVDKVEGDYPGVLLPVTTYEHDIEHKECKQPHRLNPPLPIDAGEFKSFNLRLSPAKEGKGLIWYMKIRLVDSEGDWAETESFRLKMSKAKGYK